MDSQASSPSHFDRLPPRMLRIYARSKEDTEAVTQWLVSFGTPQDKQALGVCIKDLERLAEKAIRKKKKPEVIRSQFKATIEARQKLTRLAEMYLKFFPQQEPGQTFRNQVNDLLNRFASLELELPQEESPPHRLATIGSTTKKVKIPRIVDDIFSNELERLTARQSIEDLIIANNEAWGQAGEGNVPFIAASLVTNAASAAFQPIEHRMQDLCGNMDPKSICDRLLQSYHIVRSPEAAAGTPSSSGSPFIEALQQSWNVLCKCRIRNTAAVREAAPLPPVREKPEDYFRRGGDGGQYTNIRCMSMMLRYFSAHGSEYSNLSFYHLQAPPLAGDLDDFLNKAKTTKSGLQLAFNVVLLLEGYKSYLAALPEVGASDNPRIKALRFARELDCSVTALLNDASMKSRGAGTLARFIETSTTSVKSFLTELKGFSLYSQCPGICGGQILEMHRCSWTIGLRLLTYGSYIGIVLHCYNILCLFVNFPKLPVLEKLIDALEMKFFPGGRPKKNFKAVAARFSGGRLKFKPGSGHKPSSHEWVIPNERQRSKVTGEVKADDDPFVGRAISRFNDVQLTEYHLKDEQWDQIDYELEEKLELCNQGLYPADTPEAQTARLYEEYTDDPSHRLQRLMQLVLFESFAYDFPFEKMNFLSFYLSCVRVVGLVSDMEHPEETGQRCSCFFPEILHAADTYLHYDEKEPFGHGDTLQRLQDAMTEVFGGTKVEDFLWENI